jgi:hypothetical protein
MDDDNECGAPTRRTETLARIARRWSVHPDTARRILRAAGACPVGGRRRWDWADVWRAEGLSRVHPADRATMRLPLFAAADCAERDPLGRSPRTWRRYLAERRLPVARLAPGIRRVRQPDLEDWAERL